MKAQLLAVTLAALALLAATVAADESAAPAKDAKPAVDAKLIEVKTLAKMSKEEFTAMLDQMSKVVKIIEKTDPESAKAIKDALDAAKAAFVEDKMDEVAAQLDKSFAKARAVTVDIKEALEEMIRILHDGGKRNPEELEFLKKIQERVGVLLQKQRLERARLAEHIDPASNRMEKIAKQWKELVGSLAQLNSDTKAATDADAGLKKLGDLRNALAEIIDAQDKLTKATAGSPLDKLAGQGQAQRELVAKVEDLVAKINEAVKEKDILASLDKAGVDKSDLKTAAEFAGDAGKEMKDAAAALARSDARKAGDDQAMAGGDLRKAKASLDGAIAKAAGKTPMGKLADRQDDIAKQAGELASEMESAAAAGGEKADTKDVDKAIAAMRKAGEKLRGQDAPGAAGDQKEALALLEGKKPQLAQLVRRLEEKPKPKIEDMARSEKDVADEAGKIAKEIDDKNKKNPNAKTPGADPTKKAGDSAGQASGDIGKNDQQADANEKKAIEHLERAWDEIGERIAKIEGEETQKKLAKIDEMLTQALEKQRAITKATGEVYSKRPEDGEYDRTQARQLLDLSDGEGKLEVKIGEVQKLVADEGNVVFPELLDDVRKKLDDVKERLRNKEADMLTQCTQKEIEEALTQLLAAVKEQIAEHLEKRKQPPPPPPPPPPNQLPPPPPPLMPPTAELNMLKIMQQQINSRTEAIARLIEKGIVGKDKASDEHKALAEREAKVKTLTEKMKEKLDGPKLPKVPGKVVDVKQAGPED